MRTLNLEGWEVSIGSIDTGGRVTITITGETSKNKEHRIRVKCCEWALRRFATELRDEFRRLRNRRDNLNRDNLAIFTTDE